MEWTPLRRKSHLTSSDKCPTATPPLVGWANYARDTANDLESEATFHLVVSHLAVLISSVGCKLILQLVIFHMQEKTIHHPNGRLVEACCAREQYINIPAVWRVIIGLPRCDCPTTVCKEHCLTCWVVDAQESTADSFCGILSRVDTWELLLSPWLLWWSFCPQKAEKNPRLF